METISKCQNPPHLQDLLVPLAETHLQQVGQQNQGQDLPKPSQKSKATTKRKTGTGKKRSTASKKKSTRRKKT